MFSRTWMCRASPPPVLRTSKCAAETVVDESPEALRWSKAIAPYLSIWTYSPDLFPGRFHFLMLTFEVGMDCAMRPGGLDQDGAVSKASIRALNRTHNCVICDLQSNGATMDVIRRGRCARL